MIFVWGSDRASAIKHQRANRGYETACIRSGMGCVFNFLPESGMVRQSQISRAKDRRSDALFASRD